MAGLFDFEHYYTDKSIRTDIKLDVSDLPLKSNASSSTVNEDGTVDEVDMNELVTNNVMYKVTNMVTSSGAAIDIKESVKVTVQNDDTNETETYYFVLGDALDALVDANIYTIPQKRSIIAPFTIYVGHIENTSYTIVSMEHCPYDNLVGTPISSIVVTVTPRMRWSNAVVKENQYWFNPNSSAPQYEEVDQNFWHEYDYTYMPAALAATGILGKIYKGTKWLNKSKQGKLRAVFSYDSFVKDMKKLGETAKENNLGIKTVFYDTTYADKIDRGNGDVEEIDWTATKLSRGAKYNKVYNISDSDSALMKFLTDCHTRQADPLPFIYGDTATAVIPNVSDVFKKLFDDKDELAEDFTNNFFDTYNEIMSIRGVRRFMPSKLVKKLNRMQFSLKKVGNNPKYAVDVSSCINYLDAMYKYPTPNISYGIYDGTEGNTRMYDFLSSCIRMFIDTGSKSITVLGTTTKTATGQHGTSDNDNYVAVSYGDYTNVSKSSLDMQWHAGRVHNKMWNSRYSNWKMSTKLVTVAEIKSMLADYYATMYNAHFELEAGKPGYMECRYDSSSSTFYTTVTLNDGTTREVPVNNGMAQGENFIAENYIIPPTQIVTLFADQNYQSCWYPGSVCHYAHSCLYMMDAARQMANQPVIYNSTVYQPDNMYGSIECSYYKPTMPQDTDTFDIIEWDSASEPGDVIDEYKFEPAYETLDDLGDYTECTISQCVDFAKDVMGDAMDTIDDILTVQGIMMGPAFLLLQKLRLRDAKDDYSDLMDVIRRIEWYQTFTNEPVFDNKTFIGQRPWPTYNDAGCPYIYMPARFLVPVQMYKRVRKKYKRWGRTRHKMVKRSIGVRWCEITFVDNDVYEAYPQNPAEPRQFYPIGKEAVVLNQSDGKVSFVFREPLESDLSDIMKPRTISKYGMGQLLLHRADGVEVDVNFENTKIFNSTEKVIGLSGSVFVYGIYVPLEYTAKSDERTKVRVEYRMPYIPYDAELRRWAYMNYGAFDQDPYASDTRELPSDPDTKIPGWTIFKNSSKRIGDMRASMGIYDAVSILVGILRNTFGVSCVELAETMRSKDDQELMCSGGGESTFLSWHNYGLAVKILVNDPSTGLPIDEDSEYMRTLIDVAEAFTNACANGVFGKPLNVVWCGRLKIGANNFVWEFLPIGVNHKDALKFREAALNQEDPVASLGYVNVDDAKLVRKSKPDTKIPYILESSMAYQNAVIIKGKHYVSPKNIRNYVVPHDIVLMNILEFCNLIRTKMQANGASLKSGSSMYEWKSLNDKSYRQLLLYYGLTGSMTAAKALVCGEYIEQYKDVVDRKYTENVVDMVKEYLGNLYADAKVIIEESADGGAWLSLSDGRLHLKTTSVRSTYTENSKDNFYGEKAAPMEFTERGLYIDGIFHTEEELVAMGYQVETVSDESYIDGFDQKGVPSGNDALLLHSLIATQIKEEFDKLRETFENYGGSIMYDHFVDGPNASMADMLENEFGIISGQDLIDFDNLRAIFAHKDISEDAKVGVRDVYNGGDIYEKVVSNAELSGVRKASLTKEHINVTIQPSNMTTEQLYKVIMKGSMTQANDMFSK